MARERRCIISLGNNWPELRYQDWYQTVRTLQLWMQIVGKVRLALTPWLNHSWQVPFYVTPRGLGTSPIPFDGKIFELEFDFLSHRLTGRDSVGGRAELALEPMPVADFYHRAMQLLQELGVQVAIWRTPSELVDPIPFDQDRLHRAYDPVYAQRFWQALVQADSLFKLFRTGFLGKASPSHFFWGGFDLAVTRDFPGGLRHPIPAASRACRTVSPGKPIRMRSAAPVSGREMTCFRTWPFTPMPIPSHPDSGRPMFPPARCTTRILASLSCPMKPSDVPKDQRRWCSISSGQPIPRRPILENGTGRPWIAHLVFRINRAWSGRDDWHYGMTGIRFALMMVLSGRAWD